MSAELNELTEKKMDLNELAAKVEGLSGPDREVDYLIADAVLGAVKPPFRRGHCEKYTESIDAAMTLVEGKRGWMLNNFDGPNGTGEASVWGDSMTKFSDGFGATPAIALTAAALRARSQATSQ